MDPTCNALWAGPGSETCSWGAREACSQGRKESQRRPSESPPPGVE